MPRNPALGRSVCVRRGENDESCAGRTDSHGLAGMNDRIERTFANESPVTGPRSAQKDGAIEGPNAKEEDWLPLMSTDPAFWLKETDGR